MSIREKIAAWWIRFEEESRPRSPEDVAQAVTDHDEASETEERRETSAPLNRSDGAV